MSEIKKSNSTGTLSEFTEAEPKQDRKQYMNDYYKKNKEKVLAKVLAKEVCPYCDRKVAHQQMQKHKQSKYCKTRRCDTLQRMQEIREHFVETGIPGDDLEQIIKYMI